MPITESRLRHSPPGQNESSPPRGKTFENQIQIKDELGQFDEYQFDEMLVLAERSARYDALFDPRSLMPARFSTG
jgi:hypothetical protein